jgi:hypothetical protein
MLFVAKGKMATLERYGKKFMAQAQSDRRDVVIASASSAMRCPGLSWG